MLLAGCPTHPRASLTWPSRQTGRSSSLSVARTRACKSVALHQLVQVEARHLLRRLPSSRDTRSGSASSVCQTRSSLCGCKNDNVLCFVADLPSRQGERAAQRAHIRLGLGRLALRHRQSCTECEQSRVPSTVKGSAHFSNLQEILYVDLRDGTIVRRYAGHDQGQYVLQSCFGGALQNFVLSGSEGEAPACCIRPL